MLAPEDRSKLKEKAEWLIKYYLEMNETMTNRILKTRKQAAMAFALGLIAFPLLKSLISPVSMIIVAVLYFVPLAMILLISSLMMGYRYVIIHKNPWKYFYYGNPHILEIGTSLLVGNTAKDEEAYEIGCKYFFEKFLSESPEEELDDAIRHAYNMQVLNYYKNRFYLRLLRLEKIWAIGILISTIIIILSL